MNADINNWMIYMYTFPNGKRYIGATTRKLGQRQGTDWSKYKRNKPMSDAIREFGAEKIQQTVLFEGLMENRIAAELESFFIEAYMTNCNRYNNPSFGYNQTDGREGTTKKQMSEKRVAELREMMHGLNLSRLGSHPSEETRRRQSEAQWRKRTASPLEVRQEKSRTQKAKNTAKGDKTRQRPHTIPVVVHNNLTGETLRFKSITDCADFFGIPNQKVTGYIKGKKEQPSGYIYIKESEIDPNNGWNIVDADISKSYGGKQSVILHDPSKNKTLRFDSIYSMCKYLGFYVHKRIRKWLDGKEIPPYGLVFIRESEIPKDCPWEPVEVTPDELEKGDMEYHLSDYLIANAKSKQSIITHNPASGESLRFGSLKDASVYYGVAQETISRWLCGTQNPANGLVIIRENDLDPSLNWVVKDIKVDSSPRKRKKAAEPVIMHNELTNETVLFRSITDASRCLNINQHSISRWITGEHRPPNGYVFIRASDYDPNLEWVIKEVGA